MSDKRGNWTDEAKIQVWNDYVRNKMFQIWDRNKLVNNGYGNDYESAPCSWCGKKMLKGAYSGEQPNSAFAWDIDHIDSNPNNNSLSNLQPMHPTCNKEKG